MENRVATGEGWKEKKKKKKKKGKLRGHGFWFQVSEGVSGVSEVFRADGRWFQGRSGGCSGGV